jgi:hypothetical protein
MEKKPSIFGVAVALLVLTVVFKPLTGRADDRNSRIPLRAMSQGNFWIPPCDVANPSKDEKFKVVRVVIPENFDPAEPKANVRYSQPVDDESGPDDHDDGTLIADDKDPFDVDLRKIIENIPAGLYVEFRVILRDDASRYSFYTFKDDVTAESFTGIALGDVYNNLNLCGASVGKTHNGHPVVNFYMPPGQNAGTEGYNIALSPNKAPTTPIFIDPKIMNGPGGGAIQKR